MVALLSGVKSIDNGIYFLVRSTRGAVGLVRIGRGPRPIPNELIDFLKQAEDPAQKLRPADEWPHQPGDRAQVLAGPLFGLNGVYQMQLAENRAMLLIELLGRYNEVRVDLHAIAATA
jgi:transcription antitermination factor NusG